MPMLKELVIAYGKREKLKYEYIGQKEAGQFLKKEIFIKMVKGEYDKEFVKTQFIVIYASFSGYVLGYRFIPTNTKFCDMQEVMLDLGKLLATYVYIVKIEPKFKITKEEIMKLQVLNKCVLSLNADIIDVSIIGKDAKLKHLTKEVKKKLNEKEVKYVSAFISAKLSD